MAQPFRAGRYGNGSTESHSTEPSEIFGAGGRCRGHRRYEEIRRRADGFAAAISRREDD